MTVCTDIVQYCPLRYGMVLHVVLRRTVIIVDLVDGESGSTREEH